jgi:hypothetical protein
MPLSFRFQAHGLRSPAPSNRNSSDEHEPVRPFLVFSTKYRTSLVRRNLRSCVPSKHSNRHGTAVRAPLSKKRSVSGGRGAHVELNRGNYPVCISDVLCYRIACNRTIIQGSMSHQHHHPPRSEQYARSRRVPAQLRSHQAPRGTWCLPPT